MRSRGLTLVEIAVILVAIGILVGIGVGIVSVLIRNTKFTESKEVVKSLKEAVVGYVITAGKLPCDSSEACNPPEKRYKELARALDSWGQEIVYVYWGGLRDTTDLCGETETEITLQICGSDPDCTTPLQTVRNVAFVLISKGDNRNKQTRGDGRTDDPLVVRVWDFGTNADDDLSDGNASAQGYDDIVEFMTLEELKKRYGCEGAGATVCGEDSPVVVYNMTPYTLCFNNVKVDPGRAYRVGPGETVDVVYYGAEGEGRGQGQGVFLFDFDFEVNITRFGCIGGAEGSFTYDTAVSEDTNGDCIVNYDGGGNLSDR